jgi:hypothetical protein
MVSTVKKSQAMIPEARWRRNAARWWPMAAAPDSSRGGVAWYGSRSQRRACRAGAAPPGCAGSPMRVLADQPNDKLLQLLVELRSPCCVVWVDPGARDEVAVPAQQRLGLDKKQDQRARLNAASRARSAGWSLGRATWRRSTVSWWRSTRISRSSAASPRASRTSITYRAMVSDWQPRFHVRPCAPSAQPAAGWPTRQPFRALPRRPSQPVQAAPRAGGGGPEVCRLQWSRVSCGAWRRRVSLSSALRRCAGPPALPPRAPAPSPRPWERTRHGAVDPAFGSWPPDDGRRCHHRLGGSVAGHLTGGRAGCAQPVGRRH